MGNVERDSFIAGDYDIVPTVTVTFNIPDIDWVKRSFLGAFLLLTYSENWRVTGTANIQDAVQAFIDAYEGLEIT